jgi:hypothetical protein
MQRGYAGIAGRPVRPYPQFVMNAGSDCWLELTFIDTDNNPVIPTSFSYRIDNLTTDTLILQETPVTVTSSVIDINFPASLNIINNDIGQSSQLNQVKTTTTYPDGSVDVEVFIYELVAIQVVGG